MMDMSEIILASLNELIALEKEAIKKLDELQSSLKEKEN